MNDKDLRRLGRAELLQLLLEQSKELEALKEEHKQTVQNLQCELETTNKELTECKRQLEDRQINIDKAGTLAEACLLINHVIDDAHEAAKQYLDNIENLSNRQEAICEERERESREKADRMIAEAQAKEQEILAQCEELRQNTLKECQTRENDTVLRCRDYEMASDMKRQELERSTTEKCEELIRSTQEKCAAQIEDAKAKSAKYWHDAQEKLESYIRERDGLQSILDRFGK